MLKLSTNLIFFSAAVFRAKCILWDCGCGYNNWGMSVDCVHSKHKCT